MYTTVCKPNSILSKDMLCGPFYLLITQKCLYAFLVCQDKNQASEIKVSCTACCGNELNVMAIIGSVVLPDIVIVMYSVLQRTSLSKHKGGC